MNNRHIYTKISAFTLAEILITLSIIGVIASMVIPSLVQDIQDAQFKTAWKKSYADLNQATIRVINNSGGSFKNVCGDTDHDCLRSQYLNYLNYTKSCITTDELGTNGCWHSTANQLSKTVWNPSKKPGAVLNNGHLIRFAMYSSACKGVENTINDICGLIYYDINGFKKPNIIGKDIFAAFLKAKSIKPLGSQGDGYDVATDCTNQGTGHGCSAKYLYQ